LGKKELEERESKKKEFVARKIMMKEQTCHVS